MPFVQVDRLSRFDSPSACSSERRRCRERFLAQPIALVAAVEMIGQRAILLRSSRADRYRGSIGTSRPRTPFTEMTPRADHAHCGLRSADAYRRRRARACSSTRPGHGGSSCCTPSAQGAAGSSPCRCSSVTATMRHVDVGRGPKRCRRPVRRGHRVGGHRRIEADLHREIRDGGSRGRQRHLGLMLVSHHGGHALLARSVAAMCAGSRLGGAYVVGAAGNSTAPPRPFNGRGCLACGAGRRLRARRRLSSDW